MSFEWGKLEFSEHAVHAMAERRILVEWVGNGLSGRSLSRCCARRI